MIAALVVLVVVAIAAAAGVGGLWWGERGRRIAVEHMLAHGTPDRPRAATFQGRDDVDVEDAREIRRLEIEGILASLQEEQSLTQTRFTPEQLRAEAERLHREIHS